MRLVSRSAWGARATRGTTRLSSTAGVKVHYTGDPENPALLEHHERCDDRVRSIQNAHMDGNGWNDIGYSAVVCSHGYVYVGRGPHVLPAANGPGLNSGHYAVCGLVGSSGLVKPTDEMLGGIRDAIEWLRREGDAGNEIKGHRDGYSTDCPGDALYGWVRRGAPRPGGSTPAPAPRPGTPAPPFPLPAGHWFGPEDPDPHNHSGYWASDRPHIETLQRQLRQRGWSISVTGRYDARTFEVVTAFQREKGLRSDGLTGAKTWPVVWTAPVT